MSETNWRVKYESLKAQYLESIDVSYRLGYEAGAQQAQIQSAQDQSAQAQQQAQLSQGAGNSPGGNAPGSKQSEPPNGEEQPQPGQEPQEDTGGAQSELDQHIGQLESMVQKGEFSPNDLMKAIDDLKKSKPKKAEKKPFVLSNSAHHNLTLSQKQALSDQHKIVEEVMKSFKEEESRAQNDVRSILAREGLFKSED